MLFAYSNGFAGDKDIKSICQKFIRSMLSKNEKGVRSVILPAEDAELLWQGEAPPKGMLEKIDKSIENMVITEPKEGETVMLPDGRSIVMKKGMIGKDKTMILMTLGGEKMPIPLMLSKVKGEWKIDASPLIAGRKAAAKVRARNKTEKK